MSRIAVFKSRGPDRSGQPDIEPVDDARHLVFVSPFQDGQNRLEDFFARDFGVGTNVADKRRAHEEAGVLHIGAIRTGRNARFGSLRTGDKSERLFVLLARRQGAHFRALVGRVAQPDPLESLCDGGHDAIVMCLVYENAAGRTAGLIGGPAEVHAFDSACHGSISIGVLADHQSVLAAEFELRALERIGSSLEDRAPRRN